MNSWSFQVHRRLTYRVKAFKKQSFLLSELLVGLSKFTVSSVQCTDMSKKCFSKQFLTRQTCLSFCAHFSSTAFKTIDHVIKLNLFELTLKYCLELREFPWLIQHPSQTHQQNNSATNLERSVSDPANLALHPCKLVQLSSEQKSLRPSHMGSAIYKFVGKLV